MNKTLIWIIAIVIIIVGGYYLFFNKKEPASTEPIKIGGAYILSGAVAHYGEIQMHASQLAIDEINAAGGINGRKLELITEDTAYDPKRALDAYQALKLKGVKFFIMDGSPVVATLGKKVLEDGNFAIAQGATVPSYKDGSNLTCRIALTADQFAPSIANLVFNKLGFKKIAILTMDNEYGRSMEGEFKKSFAEKGGSVVITEVFQTSEGDLRTQITKIKGKQAEIDALFLINAANTVEVTFRQLSELGWSKPIVSDVWTARNPQMKNIELVEGVIFADYQYNPDDESQDSKKAREFKEKYRAKFPEAPAYLAAAVYDSIYILAGAFKEVGDSDPKAVADYVSSIKDFPGVTGVFSFDKKDCEVSREVFFRKVEGSKVISIQ